jgi:hypothetical protein
MDGEEFLSYLDTDLIKNSLVRLYGENRYNKIVDWFRPIAKQYIQTVK